MNPQNKYNKKKNELLCFSLHKLPNNLNRFVMQQFSK